MKTSKVLTLRQMVEWANKNNISLDSPVVCYCSDIEEHFDARGIVYETPSPRMSDDPDMIDESKVNEVCGDHCYCADGEVGYNVIVITDGYHCYDENKVE